MSSVTVPLLALFGFQFFFAVLAASQISYLIFTIT